MNYIPDVVGYNLNTALTILDKYNFNITIKETFGKQSIKSNKIRVIRQKNCKNNILQLIIAYF